MFSSAAWAEEMAIREVKLQKASGSVLTYGFTGRGINSVSGEIQQGGMNSFSVQDDVSRSDVDAVLNRQCLELARLSVQNSSQGSFKYSLAGTTFTECELISHRNRK